MKALLKENEDGQKILHRYEEKNYADINDFDRQEIVRIVVAAKVLSWGNLYPPPEEKEMLAAGIVAEFPCLAINRVGVDNFCHFLNRKTGGFIDQRLKSLSSKRKRRAPVRKESKKKTPVDGELVTAEDMLFKVSITQIVFWLFVIYTYAHCTL